MNQTQCNSPTGPEDLPTLGQLWTEYEYRHDLCWTLITRITVASLALAVLPYLNNRVVEILGYFVLAAPALSVVLVLFGALVIRNEFGAMGPVKAEYRRRLCYIAGVPTHESESPKLLAIYLSALLLLGFVNIFVVFHLWVPNLPLCMPKSAA